MQRLEQAGVIEGYGALLSHAKLGKSETVFIEITLHNLATRGIVLMWQCVALTGACILFVTVVASVLSIRRVLVLEPAEVFRG